MQAADNTNTLRGETGARDASKARRADSGNDKVVFNAASQLNAISRPKLKNNTPLLPRSWEAAALELFGN